MKAAPFGKYLLIDKLGRGHATDVFLAVPTYARTTVDLVVIKRLRSGATHPDEPRSLDMTVPPTVPPTAWLACLLQHPSIAATYEVSEAEGMPYWAVEYVRGKPLSEVLSASQRSDGLPLDVGLKIVCDVLRALDHAHNLRDLANELAPLVHGAVNPHDVFITYHGRVKLLGFGVARSPKQAGGEQSPYTAPEQSTAYSDDPRVDIYSVGRLLEDIVAHRDTRITPGSGTLRGLQPDMSTSVGAQSAVVLEQVQSLWRKASAHDPEARYATAREMLDALNALNAFAATQAEPADDNALGSCMQRWFPRQQAESEQRTAALLVQDELPTSDAPSTQASAAPLPLAWWEQDDKSRRTPALSSLDGQRTSTENGVRYSSLPPPLPSARATSSQSEQLEATEPPTRPLPLAWWEQDDKARPAGARTSTASATWNEAQAQNGAAGTLVEEPTDSDSRAVRSEIVPPPPDAASARTKPLAWWEIDDQTRLNASAPVADSQLTPDASTQATTPQLKLAPLPETSDDASEETPYVEAAEAEIALDVEPSARPSLIPPAAATEGQRLPDEQRISLMLAGDRDAPSNGSIAPAELPRTLPPPSAPEDSDSWNGRAVFAAAAVLLALLFGVATLKQRGDAAQPEKVATAAATAQTTAPNVPPALRLCGSNTVGTELAPALLEALFLSKDNAEAVVRHHAIDSDVTMLSATRGDHALAASITARGSGTAFQGLAEGTCDIGMASRSINQGETERLKELGLGDLSSSGNEHVIALDGVAVIVHPNNPVDQLDSQVLHDIFTGKITDWAEVGGPQRKIQVFARDDDSGTFDMFQSTILGADKLVDNARRYMLSDALADAVAGEPGAIGFVGLAYLRTAKALAVGEPGTTALLPTRFTVATESYLLSRRLYLYTTDKRRSPWVNELLNLVQSQRGQEIVAKANFVNLELLAEHSACSLEQCTAPYAATTANAQRISVDFHFEPGSTQPDGRARRDLGRLVEFLRDYRTSRLLLLGFSDNVGAPQTNVKLSRERAETIATQLRMRGLHPSLVTGFGATMPLATNDTERGRMRNRRVEVWFETD